MREKCGQAKSMELSQRGIALLIVLWVMTILTAIVMSFTLMTRAESYGTHAFRGRMEKQFLAEAGVERGIAEMIYLSVNAGQTAVMKGKDVWKTDGTAYYGRMGSGNYVVRIFDDSGKISLNGLTDASGVMVKNLLVNLGSPPEEADAIVDSILDWKDADDLHRLSGAESDYYLSLRNPYKARNADFESLEELLLVKGVTPDIFYGTDSRKGLIQFLTLHNKTNRININVAPQEVLAALPGMDASIVEQIMQARRLADIQGTKEITGMIGGANPLISPYISGGRAAGASMICTIEASGYKDEERAGFPIRATVEMESSHRYRYVYYRSPSEGI
jgi:general secretion pathway protein K